MGVVLVLVLAALLAAAAIALWPIPRPPLAGWAFMIGFPAGELAGQLLVVTLVVMAVGGAIGWPTGVLGTASIVLGCAGALSYGALLARGLLARSEVERCLRDVRGLAVTMASSGTWLRWWRSVLGFPFVSSPVTIARDIAYAPGAGKAHLLDVIRPREGTQGAPVMLYVHGGAWTIGSKRDQALPMLCELAARGWVCVSINYRLSPRATWPDHVVDVKRALVWTKEHASEFGGDPARFLAISGGSAGGHLAALAALTPGDPAFQPGFEDADTAVDACVPLYGVLEMTGDPSIQGYLGGGLVTLLERKVMKAPLETSRALYEAASPIHRITADAPAFLVVHGTSDTLVHVDVARAFVAAFRATSSAPIGYVELRGAQHAFDLLCSPRTTSTTLGITSFLDALVAARATRPAS
jgi:acetyl esterase/lipase